MPIFIAQQSSVDLQAYGSVPVTFTATHRWGGNALEVPFTKDYDALPRNRPTDWPQRFDLSGWRFAAAFSDSVRVGGTAIVLNGSEIEESAQMQDAVLWDLRVRGEYRRHGIGRELLRWAESEVLSAGRHRLLIETQDINTAACEFYSAAGYACVLTDPFAYPELPDEARVVWAKQLG